MKHFLSVFYLYALANHTGVPAFNLAVELVQQNGKETVIDSAGNEVHFTPEWVVLMGSQ